MTIEKLLQCSADELEAMDTKQLEEFFKPYLQFTRPEMVDAASNKSSGKNSNTERRTYKTEEDWAKAQKRKKAQEMAKQLGIDLKY